MKKNDLGQFYTPQPIAKFMAEWVLQNNSKTLLDPAVGLGVFLLESKKICPDIQITSFEIDDETSEKLTELYKFSFNLHRTDYLNYFSDKKYSSIICNPPYNKFQQIPNRKKYIKMFQDKYGIKLSGYSNSYIYFLIKSVNELKEGARCCYIIPYEFFNTGYGQIVKQYLLDLKIIKHIIKFDSNLKLFSDAMTTSCILCLEKTNNENIDFISIDSIDKLKFPFSSSIIKNLNIKDIDAKEKWSQYFEDKQNDKYNNLVKFSSVAVVKRGIATGNNAFFTLTQGKINKLHLSNEVCVPCITKAPYVENYILTSDYIQQLINENKSMFIFDGTKASTKYDYGYIQYGEKLGVNKSYLISHRHPWFSIEKKQVAPILISVFSREKLKVVRNEANIKNLATFHGVYFINNFDYDSITIFFCYLITPIAQEILKQNKREYGEGLNKFEPNDLNNSLVFDITKLSLSDRSRIIEIYNILKQDNNIKYIEELNNIFIRYILK